MVDAPGVSLRRDHHGASRVPDDQPRRWAVVAQGPWGGEGVVDRDRPRRMGTLLEVPASMADQVRELATSWVDLDADAMVKVATVRQRLTEDYDYTRTPRDAGAEAPLEGFLFDRRTGHCEYFASATAVLLRSLDVPTRLVLGFVWGDPVGDDALVVRKRHAHAWVEAWVEGEGWMRVDSTPGATAPAPTYSERMDSWAQSLWRQHILDFDYKDQRDAIWGAGAMIQTRLTRQELPAGPPILGLFVLWVCIVALTVVLERMLRSLGRRLAGEEPRRASTAVDQAWQRVERAAAARGLVPPRGLPTLSAARWLGAHGPFPVAELEELAWLQYRVRHGGEEPAAHADRAETLARSIVQAGAARATS